MPVIMVHALELTENQKRIMAKKCTETLAELTNVPAERIYVFFNGYPLDSIAAGGVLNSDVPVEALMQFKIKYTEEIKAKEAINVVSIMKAKSNYVEKAWEELTSLLIKTRGEEGCLGYDLFKSRMDMIDNKSCDNYFILKEKWRDPNAIGFHTSQDYFTAFMTKGQEMFEGAIEVTKVTDIIKPYELVNTCDKFLAVFRVKAKQGKEEELYQSLMEAVRTLQERSTCKMAEITRGFEGIYDPSVMTFFQVWENEIAFQDAKRYLMEYLPKEYLAEPPIDLSYGMTSQPYSK